MFNCGQCHKITKPGESQTSKVTKTRKRLYKDKKGDVIAEGYETVHEIKICEDCAGVSDE